ncbi:MAG: T9SS type A sorting domain-containing protein [Saprospiraceae bacterium]
MNKSLLIFAILLCGSWGNAQSLSPEVIATAGAHFANSTVQISWTIGEPVTETFSGLNVNQLTQGFHQTRLLIVAVDHPVEAFPVNVFPNPTAGLIRIEAPETAGSLQIQLSDATGRVLAQQFALPQRLCHSLDLSGYPAGIFYLQIRAKDHNAIQTFMILKLK